MGLRIYGFIDELIDRDETLKNYTIKHTA